MVIGLLLISGCGSAGNGATVEPTSDGPFWPAQPTDGVWALPAYTDPEHVVPFGEVSPVIERCFIAPGPSDECDAVTVRIDGPPTLAPGVDVSMSSKFTVERVATRDEEFADTVMDLVGSIYLQASPSVMANWNEVTGVARVTCPQEDLAVGESMVCTVRVSAEFGWVENSSWYLTVPRYHLGAWPGQQDFDPDAADNG